MAKIVFYRLFWGVLSGLWLVPWLPVIGQISTWQPRPPALLPEDPSKRLPASKPLPFEPFSIATDSIQVAITAPEEKSVVENPAPLQYTKGKVSLGLGNYETIQGDAYWEQKINPYFTYQIRYKHLSSQFGPVGDGAYSATSHHSVQATTKTFYRRAFLSLDLGYRRDVNRFYGYQFISTNPFNRADSLRQVFQRYQVQIQYANTENANRFHYDLKLHFQYFQNKFKVNETQFGLSSYLSYRLNSSFRIDADAGVWTMLLRDEKLQNRSFVYFKPAFKFQRWGLQLAAGAHVVLQNDTISNVSKAQIFPMVKVSYQFKPYLSVSLGYEGNVERMTLSQLAADNPFLRPIRQAVFNTTQSGQWYVKLQGKAGAFQYGLSWSESKYRNYNFFINLFADSAKFVALYETGETNITHLNATLQYQIASKLRLNLEGNYRLYQLQTLSVPFHRPNWQIDLQTMYQPLPNLRVQIDLFFWGGIQTVNPSRQQIVQLPNIVDLNAKVEYRFWKNLSTYLALNNLFATQYQRYLHYPHQGLNFLIGLAYAI